MAGGSGKRALAGGVYAALATPRRPNTIEADTAALFDYLDAIAATGVNGLVLFGSTGEFIHFDLEERMRSVGLAIKRSRVPVLINASHSTLAGAISLAEHAFGAGAAGVLLTPPYFYRYGDLQIAEFYGRFADALGAGKPVYLYNLAPFLNPIAPGLSERLLATGAFAGIKDSSGDWTQFEALAAARRNRSFCLLVGNERLYLRGRQAGADGVVSGVAAALPELMVALEQAIASADTPRAQMLDGKVHEFLDFVDRFPSTVAIRQAAAVRGWKMTQAAVPLDQDLEAEAIRFQGWFREWLPGVLTACRTATGVRT
jgi:dihydrodipicolinate synthase/N-acetylneuraminate lyase